LRVVVRRIAPHDSGWWLHHRGAFPEGESKMRGDTGDMKTGDIKTKDRRITDA
jgi:hypothetical protein